MRQKLLRSLMKTQRPEPERDYPWSPTPAEASQNTQRKPLEKNLVSPHPCHLNYDQITTK